MSSTGGPIKKAKSIYGKLKQASEFTPLVCPILVNGDNGAEALHVSSDRIINIRHKKTALVSESLKLTAAANGVFALSANQINITSAIFTIHRHTPVGNWFHRRGFPEANGPQMMAEEVPDEDKQLNAEDYEVYINPIITGETADVEYGWEYSASFPGIRAMVKRPLGIKVSYISPEGDEIEKELYNFQARMWLHQLDYLNGKVMTHWRASEGNIDIIDGQKDHYKSLQSTIDFYKHKLDDVKSQFGREIFDAENRKHQVEKDSQGRNWKLFQDEGRDHGFELQGKHQPPSFEEAMMIDFIRSMRKDRMEYLEKREREQRSTKGQEGRAQFVPKKPKAARRDSDDESS